VFVEKASVVMSLVFDTVCAAVYLCNDRLIVEMLATSCCDEMH